MAWLAWTGFIHESAAQVPPAPQTTLISTGAFWRYLGNGQDQGQAWRAVTFDDGAWLLGQAQFGYGEGDERTVVDYGPNPNAKPITTYFRANFDVPNPKSVQRLTMRLLCDDGAVIYLNGQELYRHNMAYGSHDAQTLPFRDINGLSENRFVQYGVYVGALATNRNVLAVEVHQSSPSSDDMSFDLELIGNIPASMPDIQITTPVNGAGYGTGTIQVAADVSDRDGHVYLVRFFNGSTVIGEVYTAPFAIDWLNVPRGRYSLSAQAFDNGNFKPFSAPVVIQVGSGLPIAVSRGPYLQMGTTNSIVVRWRTDWFTNSRIVYGTSAGEPDFTVSGSPTDAKTEHELTLKDLLPDTKYYYGVGTQEEILAGGDDYFFVTAPMTPRPVRIWAIGDSGTANDNAKFVRDVYAEFKGETHTDVWIMLGDNAYEEGTDHEYQRAVFDLYPRMLRQTVLWPTLGNHDDPGPGYPDELVAYYNIFTLPRQGEAGGVASGTEKYYSFDYANIHFICLNSQTEPRTPGSPMLNWLEENLIATDKDWIIAFWHHPPYTFGSHNSDTEADLTQMRENVNPILEQHGVDLVLCGHSHNYERSYFLDGHYGFSWNLEPGMLLDKTSGHAGAPYRKPAGGMGAGRGTVYAVCGCSGEGHYGAINRHPAMCAAIAGFGSMAIEVNGNQLDAKFYYGFDIIADWFRLVKGDPANGVSPRLDIVPRPDSAQLELSWPTSSSIYELQRNGAFSIAGEGWEPFGNAPERVGRRYRTRVGADMDYQFFRLHKAP